jgi:SAM-dependent methyltransferase
MSASPCWPSGAGGCRTASCFDLNPLEPQDKVICLQEERSCHAVVFAERLRDKGNMPYRPSKTPMSVCVAALATRYQAYLAADIRGEIAEVEDMYGRGAVGADDHYFGVGRSAIDVIARAMFQAGRTQVSSVLDLPCGAARVTRHLAAFFPEAELWVYDIDPQKCAAVTEQFGVKSLDADPAFRLPSPRKFELIWVGSLLTHFDAELFDRSLRWFIGALSPGGVLVATTHGRRHVHLEDAARNLPDSRWRPMIQGYEAVGFGYAPDAPSLDIGMTLTSPSWLMSANEHDLSIKIIGFHEAGWVEAQDVLVLHKIAVNA